MTPLAEIARAMFAAAIAAVQPDVLLRRVVFTPGGVTVDEEHLSPHGRLILVGLGWAAPGLAQTFLRRSLRRPDEIFVLAPDGSAVPTSVAPFTRLAGHPVPDRRGEAATGALLDLLAGASPADGVVILLSGGTSALLARPLPPFTFDQVSALTRALVACGAEPREVATVRRHLLAAAGGRLARACRGSLLGLAVSDSPDDDLTVVASGPTVPDPSTRADACAVIARRGLDRVFPDIVGALAATAGGPPESPKPADPALAGCRTVLLGSSSDALTAAAATAQEAGLRPHILTRRLRGEARHVGATLGGLTGALAPGEGVALLAAGATTVTVRGDGCGGPALELALAAAGALDGLPERCLLACDTDGLAGSSPAAGVVVDGTTVARAAARARDDTAALVHNDSWEFFAGLPEAIVTGPTGTDVADVVFLLVAGGKPAFLGEIAASALDVPVHAGTFHRRRAAGHPCEPGVGTAGATTAVPRGDRLR